MMKPLAWNHLQFYPFIPPNAFAYNTFASRFTHKV
jgi:hypothetical protein